MRKVSLGQTQPRLRTGDTRGIRRRAQQAALEQAKRLTRELFVIVRLDQQRLAVFRGSRLRRRHGREVQANFVAQQHAILLAGERHGLVERQRGEAGQRALDHHLGKALRLGAGKHSLRYRHDGKLATGLRILNGDEATFSAERRLQRITALRIEHALQADGLAGDGLGCALAAPALDDDVTGFAREPELALDLRREAQHRGIGKARHLNAIDVILQLGRHRGHARRLGRLDRDDQRGTALENRNRRLGEAIEPQRESLRITALLDAEIDGFALLSGNSVSGFTGSGDCARRGGVAAIGSGC